MEVTYYGIPGRGESVRVLLAIGEIPFKDTPVDSKEWKTSGLKEATR